MKKVVLALLVVLTAASVSFAGYTPIITEIDNGVEGYYTFQLGIHDVGTGGVSSISDLYIDGAPVNLVWRYGGYDPTPTYVKAAALTAGQKLLDTYLLDMSSYGTGVALNGSGVNEALVTGDHTDMTVGSAGDWGMDLPGEGYPGDGSGTGIGTYAIQNPTAGLNDVMFMQVCVAEADLPNVVIHGKYTNPTVAGAGGAMMPFEINFVPEPSTIIMLVMGALCLVGLRRRK